MPGWVLWLVQAFRRGKQLETVAEEAAELVQQVDSAIHGDPPPQPLTWKDVAHIREQERTATMHGAVPPKPMGPVKAVPRRLPPPPRPRPRNKGGPKT